LPNRGKEQKQKVNSGAKRPMKIHSIAALPDGRDFVGGFEVAAQRYEFKYSPVKAEVTDKKLVLTGKMTITDPAGRPHSRDGVRAILASTQGGLGSPPRFYPVHGSSGPSTSGRPVDISDHRLPATDNTKDAAFCGVMYFRLEGLEGPGVGAPADLSHTQLNARLFPVEELGRKFHSVYSRLVAALNGGEGESADDLVQGLNDLMREGSLAIALPERGWPLFELGPPDAAPGR